ncbi:hypothetical protein BH10PSE17_BH10PSE17_14280 [soil metagenome]
MFEHLTAFASRPTTTVLPGGAEVLVRATAAGMQDSLLRGRRLVLLCGREGAGSSTVGAIAVAVAGLGASLSRVRVDLLEQSTPAEVERATQVLGRLYDLIVCDAVSQELLDRLRAGAGIPILADVAALDGCAAQEEEQRRFVIQAQLLDALL